VKKLLPTLTDGNLIAHKGPSKAINDSKKIMFADHMDEIGMIGNPVDKI